MGKRQKLRAYEYAKDHEEFDSAGWDRRPASKPKAKRPSASLVHGVVVLARGHHYDVQTTIDTGDEIAYVRRTCEVRGRLLQERTKDTLIAVGDGVWVRPHAADRGLIEMIDERRSVLSRQHPGVSIPAEDVILANPDQALVVFASAQPEPHLRMLDRFLVIAEANVLPAVICVNKIDVSGLRAAQELFDRYERIGYRVLYASVKDRRGIAELEDLLSDRITVVTGPSGVGKSSLINAIHPELNLQVGDLRDFMNKGKHTTRSAQLYSLPFGAESFVADTPGIRELGLFEIDRGDLGFYFREIAPFTQECRYPDCRHDHEPDCAVRAAVAAGHIYPERYDSYLRLLHGEE